MAESAVSSLLQSLSQLLLDEVNLLSSAKDKIRSLSKELEFIDAFLQSSSMGKRSHDDAVAKVVERQIREAARQAQDVVDTYILANVNRQRSRNVKKLLNSARLWKMLHRLDGEIEKIKRSIDEIHQNKERYGTAGGGQLFQSGGDTAEAAESVRRRRRDVEEEEVVGLVYDSAQVIEKLMEAGSRLDVVSIIGMGGLGKTTLARKIYNKEEVKGMFRFRAWGYVSDNYRPNELFLSLLKCLLSTSDYNNLFKRRDDGVIVSESIDELKKKMSKCLKGNKYLVVLDDIWKTQVWDNVQEAFPDDKNGSRIIITSRNKEVASYTGTTSPYYLPFLKEQESWELFSKKVFRGGECPSNLKDIGKSIVANCHDLPLAIIVLAGLVAKKDKSEKEWLRIKNHVSWRRAQDEYTRVRDILKLSYDDLSQELKLCFLYFGIYPEDYEIRVKQLIQLWVAEGFIQPEIGTSNALELEDIGDYYLEELVDRSLIQVTSKRSDGSVKTCQIHDLLRDMCMFESKATEFMEVCTELNIDKCNPRRMSLHCKTRFSFLPTKYNQSRIHSFFLFGGNPCWDKESREGKWITENFKLARVLPFDKVSLDLPPKDLRAMVHLKYLRIETGSLSGTNILASLCSLWNLETLRLTCQEVSAIPSGIWKLKQMRHFNLRTWIDKPRCTSRGENSEALQNLQTLSGVQLDSEMISMLNNDYFPNLKTLCLLCISEREQYKGVHALSLLSLLHLSKLSKLKLRGPSAFAFDASAFSPNLFPSNLTKITLTKFYNLNSKTLGGLPNLQTLKLKNGFTLDDLLHCADGEFPALQVFHMEDACVKRWILEEGAMPCLSSLFIDEYVEEFPTQLASIISLRQVHVTKQRGSIDTEPDDRFENVELDQRCKLIISLKGNYLQW